MVKESGSANEHNLADPKLFLQFRLIRFLAGITMIDGTKHDALSGSNRSFIHPSSASPFHRKPKREEIHLQVILCRMDTEGRIWIVEHFI